jgi:alkylation response protein AidB-like acyl-CoA dehydrogenase
MVGSLVSNDRSVDGVLGTERLVTHTAKPGSWPIFNLGWTAEQRELGDLAYRIASKYSTASFADRDALDAYWQDLVKAGLAGIALPEEYGGGAQGLSEMCLVTERSSAAGFPAAKLILSQGIVGSILLRHGTPEQRSTWLPPIAAGDVQFCFALTEAEAGSNARQMRTRAESVGKQWRIRGEKYYISAVDEADAMLLAAQTPDANGITLFIIDEPQRRLGFEKLAVDITMFEHQFAVHFDDVLVGPESVVGQPGNGFAALFDGLNPERLLTSAQSLGMGRWGIDLACSYAKQRAVFDAPIGSHQAIAHPLAESWVQLEAAWSMVVHAARMYDQGQPCGLQCNAAKFAASDAGWLALDRALQTHGGSGFLGDLHLIERLMVTRLFKVAPVTRELALNHIAMEALGLPKSY